MARFFKPLLGAVALAAATLTSTGAMAQSYAYNTQVSVVVPKGSAAEATSKDKSKPTGVKFTGCAADISAGSINVKNPDFLQFSVKYDAGKTVGQIGDVYLILERLSDSTDTGAMADGIAGRYFVINRPTQLDGMAIEVVDTATTPGALHAAAVTLPFLKASDNLGTGAQTEVLFGGNLNLTGLGKGMWALHSIIAKPGTTPADAADMDVGKFSFGHPETWAAFDTAVFMLGSPLPLNTASEPATDSGLVNYQDKDAATVLDAPTNTGISVAKTTCE